MQSRAQVKGSLRNRRLTMLPQPQGFSWLWRNTVIQLLTNFFFLFFFYQKVIGKPLSNTFGLLREIWQSWWFSTMSFSPTKLITRENDSGNIVYPCHWDKKRKITQLFFVCLFIVVFMFGILISSFLKKLFKIYSSPYIMYMYIDITVSLPIHLLMDI